MNLLSLFKSLTASSAFLVFGSPGGCSDVAPPPVNGNANGSGGAPADFVVRVDTLRTFQTMTGWEAVAQAGQAKRDFPKWRDQLLDKAVNELGINRLRMELRSGSENRIDYYVRALTGVSANVRCERWLITNDNTDPGVIDPTGFRFSEIDSVMVNVVIPMKKRLEARGERLFLNLNYIAFLRQCAQPFDYVHSIPGEYAEIILAAFLHLKARYGFVPDAVEIVLEPDNGAQWNGTKIGNAILMTSSVLAAEGFRPAFIGPSTTSMSNAVTWTRDILQVPGAARLLSEISYHRYHGVSDESLRALAQLAVTHNLKTAMLEHIGSGVEDLHADLTTGRASAWQQFALGVGVGDGGGQYYQIIDNVPRMATRTRYLRQYFRYVRMGARRVGADANGLLVAAFRNPNGRDAVVIHTTGDQSIEVRGLAPGRYGVSITTKSLTGSELGDRSVARGGSITVRSPGEGVMTVYSK